MNIHPELRFRIDEWHHDWRGITEVLGALANFDVAVSAFDKVVELRPHRNLTLRQGARVLREHSPAPQKRVGE